MGNKNTGIVVLEHNAQQLAERGWRLAYSLLRDVQESEDVVQQAFVVATTKPQAVPVDDPWPWFGTVIANEARNVRRKRARRNTRTADPEEEMAHLADDAGTPATAAGDRELAAMLANELDSLPADEREALVLVHVGGLSYSSGAEVMGVGKSTFGRNVQDGLLKLRRRMGVDEERSTRLLKEMPVAPMPATLLPAVHAALATSASSVPLGSTVITGATMGKLAMTVTAAIVLAVLGFLGWQQFSAQGAASNQRVVVAGADGMPLEQGLGDGQDSPLPGDASGSGNSGDNSVLTGDATTDGGASHKVRTDAADGTDPETPSDVKTGDTVDPDSGDTVDPGSGTDNGQDASPDKAEPDSHFVLGKLPPWDFGGDYRDFAISPDGKMLVVGSDTKLIGLHATSGDILWERILSRGSCYGVDFTQDSKRVVVAGPNSKVRLYSAADGAFLTDAENSGYSMGAASSSDGKFVAISMYASTAIKLLHPETLAELRTIKAPKNSYGHVYLSKDGKTVFAFVRGDNGLDQYEGRNSLWAWDSETGEGRQVFKGEDHELILRDCAVAPDGSFALFEIERGKGRYQLVSVDVTTGSILGRFGDDEHWATSPAISPDGTRAAATYGSGVVVWDPRSFQLILKCQDSARAQYLKFSADGSRLYGLERGQMVQAWDAVSGDRISRGETVISSHADEVQRAEFTPDGKRAVSIDRKGRLIAWNVTDGSPCGAVEDTARLSDFDVVDNNSFATVDLSGAVALWRINGCEQIRKLTNSPVGAIQRVEYAAGPNRLFCFTGRELVVWDVASGDVLYNFELKIEARLLPNLFVVDDAGRVAIGDRDNGIWTVDLATETARRVYQADDERNRIYDLSFGPDGLLWYCQSSYSSQLFAVDFSEGTLTRTLEFTRNEGDGPPAESPYMFINFAVSENADHAFAYARNRDGYKVMWLNLETSTIESRFMMRSGRVTSVAVTPDGTLGIACGQEKVLRGWTLQD